VPEEVLDNRSIDTRNLPDAPVSIVTAGGTLLAGDAEVPEERASPYRVAARELVVVEAIPIRRAPCDLRARFTSVIESFRRRTQDAEIGLSFKWDKNLPARLDVDDDKLAWLVRVLVEAALGCVRRGCRLRPGGNIGIVVRLADSHRPLLTIEVWFDAILSESSASALRRERRTSDEVSLALVRDVVEAHSGTIDVGTLRAEVEDSTLIEIHVPLAPAAALRTEPPR
jgi:hypothetical protein